MRDALQIGVTLLSLASASACSSLAMLSTRRAGCPVVPMSSEELTESHSMRAEVLFRIGENKVGFELVVHPEADGLIVIALAPNGSRLFSVKQHGRKFEIDAGASRKLRFLALLTMDALHRAFWIEPAGGMDANSLALQFAWAGEQVLETRSEERRRRLFIASGGDFAAPDVAIDYSRDRAEIRNTRCGYEAVVAVLHE